MRITHSMLADTTIRNLEINSERLDKLQDQLTSGKRLRRPSDDPVAVTKSLSYRSAVADNQQYLRNVDGAVSWLNSTDSALGGVTDLLSRARELAVQGGNDTLDAVDRSSIAAEINQIILNMVQLGNSTVAGQSIFAGSRVTSAPFTANSDTPSAVAYNGDAAELRREVDSGATVPVNVPGSAVFTQVFNTLIGLRDDLAANNGAGVRNRLTELDAGRDTVLMYRAQVGARANRLESVANRLNDLNVNLTGLLSKNEDLDLAEATVQFSTAESVYKAALAIGARAIQPSLVDFLR